MPYNLTPSSTPWVKVRRDTDGSSGTGSNPSDPLVFESFSPDLGITSDSAASSDAGTFSLIALFKRLLQKLTGIAAGLPTVLGQTTKANSFPVTLASDSDVLSVNGSGFTQPVSAASLPLPSGAATAANQGVANTSLNNIDAAIGDAADGAASSDTGTFSLLALTKRGLQQATALQSQLPSALGFQPVSNSISVCYANNGPDVPVALVNGKYSFVSRSGSTSVTANQKTQIAAANPTRNSLFVQNRSTTVAISIWSGASGAEFLLVVLQPGSVADNGDSVTINSGDRIAVSSAGSSVGYLAVEK